ncbi:MAG: hypothetical protein GC181_14985 [Bacteroidetes bacterium]|nr:hypothetical protein [Bacteroidota bacterium]
MDSKFAGDPLILGVGKNTSIYLFKLPAYLELGKTKWRWQTGLDLSLASSLFVKSIFFNSKFTLPLERRIGVVFHQSLSYSVNIDEIEVSVSPVFEYALVNYPLSSGLGWVTPRSMAIRVGVCF